MTAHGSRANVDQLLLRSRGLPPPILLPVSLTHSHLDCRWTGATACRTELQDWARHEDVDELPSEFALAHVEAKTVAAYSRDSLVEKRRPVTLAWCEHVTGAPGN